MKIITPYISCFLYSILCTLSMADVISRYYTLDPSLDNKVSNNSLATEKHSESLIECGFKCGELCTFFGFNLQLKKCHIHQSRDSSELTVTEAGWRYFYPDVRLNALHKSCMEILQNDPYVKGKDGVYSIYMDYHMTKVYCDMTTDGGGWTVIQKREDGSTDFFRNWTEYKKGFGDPSKNYWIGNDGIHHLTQKPQELRVDLLSFDGERAYAKYSKFTVGDETSKYKLNVTGYSGTAGDSLAIHHGLKFSTRDQDNDMYSGSKCAVSRHGGWWYGWHGNCADSNLNGQYGAPALYARKYPFWYHWKSLEALKWTKMMIKPKS